MWRTCLRARLPACAAPSATSVGLIARLPNRMNSTAHASDSSAQRGAESVALTRLGEALGCALVSRRLDLGAGTYVQIDGYNAEHRILCEVYSRVGPIKGSQPDKLASDVLKLGFVERRLGGSWRKILCFVDPAPAKLLQGKAWLAAATSDAGVEFFVVSLPQHICDGIVSAQIKQMMVSPPDGSEGSV